MPREPLLARLDHAFRLPELLEQALTHRSHSALHNNERLEFVGDAVLNCVIAQALFERFPQIAEGDLSRIRASLVNRDTLATLARELDIGGALQFGEGEKKGGGSGRASILADALEAIFGAIFIDGGFDAARRAIIRVFDAELDRVDPATLGKDPKTRLQEWLQARRIAVPEYVVVDITGEAHAQTFTVECRVPSYDVLTRGAGPSRRVAEQAAAAHAYVLLTSAPRSKRPRE
jgi:ribonuclease III